jgi:mitochondrial import inner membrane translocase subunit TIM44
MVASQHVFLATRRVVTGTATSRASQYGRTAAYRRLSSYATLRTLPRSIHLSSQSPHDSFLPPFPPSSVLTRSLHSSLPRYQQPQPKEEVRDPPRSEDPEQKATGSPESEQKSEEKKEDENGEKSDGKKKEGGSKAPPPPHGDKSPWRVFTETLKSEFKASQEWQDSTKQLAGEVKAFNESDAVRRAREASEAASSGVGKVVKGTGKVIGQSASWTWNTSAVQGARAGVNMVGRGIEQASRPIRETKAFKDISEAIDDGSSSRYGGWSEKEERRLRRERNDLKNPQQKIEKMEENPE